MKQLVRNLLLSFLSFIISSTSFSQTNKAQNVFQQILDIDYKSTKPNSEKLAVFYALKNIIERTQPLNDSAFILILLKISKYEFIANADYQASINFADKALQTANSFKKETLKALKINCYYNLASSYQQLGIYSKALDYYDTVILLSSKNFIDINSFQLDARFFKADIYFFLGDYQKVIDESILGINLSIENKDSLHYLFFTNRFAQALSYENKLQDAIINARTALSIAKKLGDQFELSISYKILGFIFQKKNIFDSAEYFFTESIKIRHSTKDYEQIVNDYIDLGNFYLNSLADYSNAKSCYNQGLVFANKITNSINRNLKLAQVNINMGETNLQEKKYTNASKYFLKSFTSLQINLNNDITKNPASIQLSKIANKDPVIILMSDKTNLLLQLYKSNADITYLNSSIQTAIVADSVITQIRHEQIGEESKLYWRDKTRDLYTNAIEACYLANNANLAFYFMEKSRAALLNDKLNELGASAHLPAAESKKQETYQIRIVELEQKFSTLSDTSKMFQTTQLQLLNAKNDFEQYIKSLETKYPEYYQYKYEDDVPPLQNVQQYLAKNNQSFVYYFLDDSTIFILAVTANNTKLIRVDKKDFNKDDLYAFLKFCSNKQALNNNYPSFIALSNSIYKKLFQPLSLQKGRVIICTDNIVIPFDALCTDASGKKFLLSDYSFSYVYSARYLMKHFNSAKATGNFVGFAPVSFQKYLYVNDLKNAAESLNVSASNYPGYKLFTHQNASRNNFFKYASSYSVISIFSHARADTTDNEPVLYMQDSVIYLSQLQLLNDPATQLVMLSACQTNVGKAATGEGIYSLARGFASAGIPSVSATLWKADEASIYSISEKFNEYLSGGVNKDEALQKAKLDFIQNNNNNEKLLPYYWANMILIGNTDALQLTTMHKNYWWWIVIATAFIALTIMLLKRKNKNQFKVPVKL